MKKLIGFSLAFAPFFALAAEIKNADNLIAKFNSLVNQAIPVLITFAVLYIIFAVVKYMIAGSEDDKKKSAAMVGYGIAGLAVILSIWGLVNLLVNTFDLDNTVPRGDIPKAIPLQH
jgi:hypothetical protein